MQRLALALLFLPTLALGGQWPKLAATEVGLMYDSGGQPWGTPLNWNNGSDGGCSYRFAVDGGAPFAMYFESQDPSLGTNHLKNWTAGGAFRPFNAAMFCSKQDNPWGLKDQTMLARVEVNGGDGGGDNIHFVATKVENVSGTKEFPIDPQATLVDARKRFDDAMKGAGGESRRRLAKGESKAETALAEYLKTNLRARAVEPAAREQMKVRPHWDRTQRQLVVEFEYEANYQLAAGWEEIPEYHCPEGAPCMEPAPRGQRQVFSWGTELQGRYVYDHRGKLVEAKVDEPAFTGLSSAQ